MAAIFESRIWWTGKLRHRPFNGEDCPWWVIIDSDDYPLTGLRAPDAKDTIQRWCRKNCVMIFDVGHSQLVKFASEDDAILFKIAFSKIQ